MPWTRSYGVGGRQPAACQGAGEGSGLDRYLVISCGRRGVGVWNEVESQSSGAGCFDKRGDISRLGATNGEAM